MALSVRKANPSDRDELGALGAMLMRTHYAFDSERFLAPGDAPEAGYGSFLAAVLEDPGAVVFVAEDDRRIVGYVYAGLEPMSWKELRGPAGFVHDLVVAEDSRGGGAATVMMEAAVEWLRARGAPRVILWSASSNAVAQRLFQRIGFRSTMIEMTLELSPNVVPPDGG